MSCEAANQCGLVKALMLQPTSDRVACLWEPCVSLKLRVLNNLYGSAACRAAVRCCSKQMAAKAAAPAEEEGAKPVKPAYNKYRWGTCCLPA